MSGTTDPIVLAQALGRGRGKGSSLLARRRRLEDMLSSALAEALESIGAPLMIFDFDSRRMVYGNEPAARMLGRTVDELNGLDPFALIAPDERAHLGERFRLKLAGHEVPPVFETAMIAADGRRVPLEVAVAPLETDGDSPHRQVVLVRDRTAAETDSHRAAIAEQLLDDVLTASQELVVVVDPKGIVRRFNSAAEVALGIPAADVLNCAIADLDLFTEQGTRHIVWSPFAGSGASAGWVIWRGEDVTERERAEGELTRLKMTEAADAEGRTATGRMISSLTHDLREPARVTGGFAALLEDGYGDQLDDRGRRMLAAVRDAASKMSDLLDDLAAFGRADRKPKPAPVDLQELVERVEERLGADIRASGARIETGVLPTVVADPAGLEQVLGRVLENALKFRNGTPPVISIVARRVAGAWQVDVADDGIGIEPRDRERVFELFCRLHPRDAYPGTGSGLAICRRIIERHGGSIWVGDSPDHGTTLCFTIPDRPSAASA